MSNGKKSKRKHAKISSEQDSLTSNDVEEDFISLSLEPTKEERKAKKSKYSAQTRTQSQDESSNDSESEEVESLICFPWLDAMFHKFEEPKSINNLLEKEISCFTKYLEPSKAEIRLRAYIVHKVRTAIEEKFPEATVEVFGSFSTRLYLPNSDIDLVICLPKGTRFTMRLIASILMEKGVCRRDPQVIDHAVVPVIKFEDNLTPIKVDLVVNSTSGLSSVKIINDMVKRQPGLRPLTLIVKHFLALRDLNEVFKGGLGGYAIVCMVLSFLQMHPKVASGVIDPEKNLGPLLLDFFQLYGINFNINAVAISVDRRNSRFVKGGVKSREGSSVYSIKDPQDSSNDIGCKSFESRRIMRAFQCAYLLLTDKAFSISEEINEKQAKHWEQLSKHDRRKTSLLATFLHIPVELMQQREQIRDTYEQRQWIGEAAADTFPWETDELFVDN